MKLIRRVGGPTVTERGEYRLWLTGLSRQRPADVVSSSSRGPRKRSGLGSPSTRTPRP
jgi:hypothetical protein